MNEPNPLSALLALEALAAEKRGVRHMPREIIQQPRMWLDACERVLARGAELAPFSRAREPGTQLVLIGAGSSDYAAQLVRPSFELAGRIACAQPSTDLLTRTEALEPGGSRDFVYFSRSGTTAETVAVAQRFGRTVPESRHLVITCNPDAALLRAAPAERSFGLVLDEATNDRALAMTSSFTSMALAGLLLAEGTDPERTRRGVTALAAAAEMLLADFPGVLRRLAEMGFERVIFLGSGRLRASAGEAALKLLELTAGRVATFHESFLGVRHGPLAVLNHRTLLVGFLSSDAEERALELNLIAEARQKSLAGRIALVAPEDTPRARSLSDDLLLLSAAEVPSHLRPLLDVVTAQILALFASLAHGLWPDSPSPNGAIARVVADVGAR